MILQCDKAGLHTDKYKRQVEDICFHPNNSKDISSKLDFHIGHDIPFIF